MAGDLRADVEAVSTEQIEAALAGRVAFSRLQAHGVLHGECGAGPGGSTASTGSPAGPRTAAPGAGDLRAVLEAVSTEQIEAALAGRVAFSRLQAHGVLHGECGAGPGGSTRSTGSQAGPRTAPSGLRKRNVSSVMRRAASSATS